LLVVDDDPAIREALSAALTPQYVVHGAATGREALALLQSQPVSGIILDAVLDGEHGLDLVAPFRVRSDAPILLLTGHGSEALAARAVRARVDDYLKKPVSLPALSEALDRLAPRDLAAADLPHIVRWHLEAHLGTGIRLRELASRLQVTEAHLCRRFRQAYGRTPRQYLRAARIQRAARLLHETARSVKEIARAVGFPSLVTFRRCFTRAVGQSPLAFRAAARRRTTSADGPPPADVQN
jgi:YesN/AraC family two-component response regulator